MDNWIETGRQFVDGVAGNRPGTRRTNSPRLSSASFEKVGRWVGDKLDWLLEDEDGWLEPWQTDSSESFSDSKRPLEAVSRRVSHSIPSSPKDSQENLDQDEWPEESSFRVERWRRSPSVNENINSERLLKRRRDSIGSDRRPLPRSNRRRD